MSLPLLAHFALFCSDHSNRSLPLFCHFSVSVLIHWGLLASEWIFFSVISIVPAAFVQLARQLCHCFYCRLDWLNMKIIIPQSSQWMPFNSPLGKCACSIHTDGQMVPFVCSVFSVASSLFPVASSLFSVASSFFSIATSLIRWWHAIRGTHTHTETHTAFIYSMNRFNDSNQWFIE